MNYFPFHVGDYTAHTAHLDPIEDLAYRRMLDAYYLREGPLPSDHKEVARLVRLRDHLDAVTQVLGEFFELTDEGWRHARCDQEIAHMQDKQAKAKASAAASVNARKAKVERPLNGRLTDAQRTVSERETDVELPTPTPTPVIQPQPQRVGAGGLQPSQLVEPMSPNWQPSEQFKTLAKLSGLPATPDPAGLGEFVAYWLTQPHEVRTQVEWDNALVKSLKRNQAMSASARASPPGRRTGHTGFDTKDYSAGVNADGSLV